MLDRYQNNKHNYNIYVDNFHGEPEESKEALQKSFEDEEMLCYEMCYNGHTRTAAEAKIGSKNFNRDMLSLFKTHFRDKILPGETITKSLIIKGQYKRLQGYHYDQIINFKQWHTFVQLCSRRADLRPGVPGASFRVPILFELS